MFLWTVSDASVTLQGVGAHRLSVDRVGVEESEVLVV